MVELGNIDVMALISKATNGIAEGEVQQLTLLQNTSTSEADYLEVIYRKTALLFEVSAESGAVLGGASASEAAAYREYGRHLGLAFQLMDDWLDYEGSAQELGKNTGDDLAEGKVTLPIILALKAAGASDRRILEQAITQPGSVAFEDVRCIAERCGGIETTKHRAAAEASLAESALQGLPDSACKSQMIRLSQFAVERSN